MTPEVSANEIRWIRSWRGWTQRDLADEIGTDAVTISRWERGVTHPRPAVTRRLSELIVQAGPQGHTRFVEDPAARIDRIERALRAMRELKRHAKQS
jgi:transcriptional regulator with XRE-family HTH domain